MHLPTTNVSASQEAQAIDLASQAQRLRQQNQPVQARACYEAALRLAPDLPALHFNYANLLQAMGDRTGAETAFRQVLAKDVNHLPALVNLARLLPTAEYGDEVEQLYRPALNIQPDEPRVLRGLASVLQARQRLREARPLFERALAIQPDTLGFRSDYGFCSTHSAKTTLPGSNGSRSWRLTPSTSMPLTISVRWPESAGAWMKRSTGWSEPGG